MKKIIVLLVFTGFSFRASAQAQELEQLALNIEKLAQFRQILADLKKAYDVLYKGYTTIKNIAQGNFNLHETFLNGLLEASPMVKKHKKVSDIISMQVALVKEYKTAFSNFKSSGHFSVEEIDYMSKVYGRLFDESLKHLDDLVNVLASGKMRMSDAERLKVIDGIYSGMSEKISFLRHFNTSTSLLGVQRAHEQRDVEVMRKLHDVR